MGTVSVQVVRLLLASRRKGSDGFVGHIRTGVGKHRGLAKSLAAKT